jgi:hypothetical protein
LTAIYVPDPDDAVVITSGPLPADRGGTGLAAVGAANRILGANAAGTAVEYKTLTAGSNVTITHAAGAVTGCPTSLSRLQAPDNSYFITERNGLMPRWHHLRPSITSRSIKR